MSNTSVPRLKDVAKAANVSLAAASRILRGDRERFGEETCRRVVEASQRLGWRRNLLVNGMQTGKTKTVGVMIPPYDSFWVNVLSGIHDELSAADYLPITVWTGNLEQMPHFERDDARRPPANQPASGSACRWPHHVANVQPGLLPPLSRVRRAAGAGRRDRPLFDRRRFGGDG